MENFNKEWILFGPQTGYSVIEDAVEGLYLIYCGEPNSVKIGISKTPLSRLSNLRTGSPSKLHLIFYSKLLGKAAEETLHQSLLQHRRAGEWFDWNGEVQGFLLGVIFAVSGVIQVSWPFAADADHSMFVKGVDWAHGFLDPNNEWTLEAMTGMGGEKAFELFQSWCDVATARNRKKNEAPQA